MAGNNRVIWDEGLFVRPQHFQQESRYLEHYVNHRIENYNEFLYGLTELQLNQENLKAGKLQIERARGVMPDGAVFNIPHDTPPPPPLDIRDSSAANQVVYLALPIRTQSAKEIQWPESQSSARYVVEHQDVKDLHSPDGDFTDIKTAKLNFSLMLGNEDISSYSTLAVAQIRDRESNNTIVLNDNFYPTSFSLSAIPKLKSFIERITHSMHERARELAERIGSPDQAGVADVTDFLLLQALNRIHPRIRHLASLRLLHPERLYEALVEACGELSTFREGGERFAEEYAAYQHDDPKLCFEPLQNLLTDILNNLIQSKVIALQVEKQDYGRYKASLSNESLLQSHDFILAFKAQMDLNQLRHQLLHQVKVASLEKLSDLISSQLPGIPLRAIPVAPRHLPYHAGFIYFELDNNSEEWRQMMRNTSGFGFHIAGELPELALEFWALRKE